MSDGAPLLIRERDRGRPIGRPDDVVPSLPSSWDGRDKTRSKLNYRDSSNNRISEKKFGHSPYKDNGVKVM